MRPQWSADVELTEADAAALIEQQFPALAPVTMAPLGIGWDNVAYLVNDAYVFRFPRRDVAAGLVEREARILPLLAPHLPLPIPVPELIGRPTATYPYVFAGYPFLPGQTACRSFGSDDERAAAAPALARFLAALHSIPVDAETRAWAPGDEIARTDLPARAPVVKERLLANAAGLEEREVRALIELVDGLATTPRRAEPPCWVHGDLYACQLLVDESRRLAGVIDWGDVHLGDPALDLSIAISFLPPAGRPVFRQSYGDVDDATWRRARFRAIHYGAVLASYGQGIGDAAIMAAGSYALRYAAVEE